MIASTPARSTAGREQYDEDRRSPAQVLAVIFGLTFLLVGFAGFIPVRLLAATRATWAKAYLLGGGVAYGVVAAYGFLVKESSGAMCCR